MLEPESAGRCPVDPKASDDERQKRQGDERGANQQREKGVLGSGARRRTGTAPSIASDLAVAELHETLGTPAFGGSHRSPIGSGRSASLFSVGRNHV
jgi:hypothetical protein